MLLSVTLLMLALASGPPPPPGMSQSQPPLASPKAGEFMASLGIPMARTGLATPMIVIGGFQITNVLVNILAGTTSLSWQNGTAPFQIWQSPTLTGPWSTAGNSSLARTKIVPLGENQYWKLQAQAPSVFNLNSNTQPRLEWTVPDTDMSDSLGNFTVQKSTDNQQTWANITGDPNFPTGVFPSTARSAQDNTTPPVSYRLLQTTANGAVVPYNISSLSNVQSGALNWVTDAVSGGCSVQARGSAVDSQGRIVYAAYGSGSFTIGGTTITSPAGAAFIVRVLPNGTVDLVKKLAVNDLGSKLASVAIGANDSIIVSGVFVQLIDFGGGHTFSDPMADDNKTFPGSLFVLKMDSSGNYVWARAFSPQTPRNQFSQCYGILTKIDSQGRIIIGAWLAGTVTFGSFTLTANPSSASVGLIKFSSDGQTVIWATIHNPSFGNQGRMYDMALTSTDDVMVVGDLPTGTLDLGGGSISGPSNWLAKYSGADGSFMFQKSLGGAGGNNGLGVDRATGDFYWTGNLIGPTDFGNGKTTAFGGAFLAGYSSTGLCKWAKSFNINPGFGYSSADIGTSATVDSSGNVFATGTLSASGSLNGSHADQGHYAVSFSAGGTWRWSQVWSGSGLLNFTGPLGIIADAVGNVYEIGSYQQTVNFGGITKTAPSATQLPFVAQYNQ